MVRGREQRLHLAQSVHNKIYCVGQDRDWPTWPKLARCTSLENIRLQIKMYLYFFDILYIWDWHELFYLVIQHIPQVIFFQQSFSCEICGKCRWNGRKMNRWRKMKEWIKCAFNTVVIYDRLIMMIFNIFLMCRYFYIFLYAYR